LSIITRYFKALCRFVKQDYDYNNYFQLT